MATPAQAAPINEVDYFSLSVGQIIDFEGLAGGGAPGTNYDNILNFSGVLIGERFAGQVLGVSGNSDTLSGNPTAALSVVAGAAGQNLNIFTRPPDGNVLTGLGPLGFPQFDAIGEGAVAILFDNDQSEFGFQSVGGDLGEAFFSFFQRDGTLIDELNPMGLGTDFFGFQREGGVNDIAGISIWNTDPAGIGFDDIIFDVPGNEIPAPGGLPLLAIGLIAMAVLGRRRRQAG
jgi:hypothetical protein